MCVGGGVMSVCDALIRWGFSGHVRKPSRLWQRRRGGGAAVVTGLSAADSLEPYNRMAGRDKVPPPYTHAHKYNQTAT